MLMVFNVSKFNKLLIELILLEVIIGILIVVVNFFNVFILGFLRVLFW